jgi:BirA family biotin operon repressor/biotin-[acetyl-CoA-carboxylase] ligase
LAEPTFDRARFRSHLVTHLLGRNLLARAAVESTNDTAWEAFAVGAAEGTVVVADAQTRGRGRAGRAWHTEPGKGLALSVLLPLGCDRGLLGLLPLGAGLALARALERLGVATELKWPNDLLRGGRKLSGVLCESRGAALPGDAGTGAAVVIGVGVNVSERREDFPPEIRERTTSLALEGFALDRETVAAAFLNALEPLRTALEEGGRDEVLDAWRARATFWGTAVQVRTPAGEVRGVARTLDAGGGLVLRLDSGQETTVVAGDVEWAPSETR